MRSSETKSDTRFNRDNYKKGRRKMRIIGSGGEKVMKINE